MRYKKIQQRLNVTSQLWEIANEFWSPALNFKVKRRNSVFSHRYSRHEKRLNFLPPSVSAVHSHNFFMMHYTKHKQKDFTWNKWNFSIRGWGGENRRNCDGALDVISSSICFLLLRRRRRFSRLEWILLLPSPSGKNDRKKLNYWWGFL